MKNLQIYLFIVGLTIEWLLLLFSISWNSKSFPMISFDPFVLIFKATTSGWFKLILSANITLFWFPCSKSMTLLLFVFVTYTLVVFLTPNNNSNNNG